jgi:hypothetical protein
MKEVTKEQFKEIYFKHGAMARQPVGAWSIGSNSLKTKKKIGH